MARWLGAGGLVAGGWWLVPKIHPHMHSHTYHKHRKKRTHLFSTKAMVYKVFGKNGELLKKNQELVGLVVYF